MTDDENRSDVELLLAARTSAEAFGVFYERHFAMRHTVDGLLAE